MERRNTYLSVILVILALPFPTHAYHYYSTNTLCSLFPRKRDPSHQQRALLPRGHITPLPAARWEGKKKPKENYSHFAQVSRPTIVLFTLLNWIVFKNLNLLMQTAIWEKKQMSYKSQSCSLIELSNQNLNFPYLNTDYHLTEPVLSFHWAGRRYCSMMVTAAVHARGTSAGWTLPGSMQPTMVPGWRDNWGEAAFDRPRPHCLFGTCLSTQRRATGMLEPDPSRQQELCKYIPLISSAGPILCQGWKVRNQALGLRAMQMGWRLQSHQETVPSVPTGLGRGCYCPLKHPLAFSQGLQDGGVKIWGVAERRRGRSESWKESNGCRWWGSINESRN